MTPKVIDTEITNTNITTIRQNSCPSLSGRSQLQFSIAKTSDAELLIRIDKNSGTGKFNQQWIKLSTIEELITKAESPFSWAILSPVFKHQSSNNCRFIGAILISEGIVTATDGGYQRTDRRISTLSRNPAKKDKKTAKKGAES